MKELEGKVAIVTGAGQGVGEGIAFALCDQGASVVAAGRTLEKVEATVAEIGKRGGRGLAVECDVNDAASLERLVSATVDACRLRVGQGQYPHQCDSAPRHLARTEVVDGELPGERTSLVIGAR